MLQWEHSAILSTGIKLPCVIKIFVLSFLNGRLRQVLLSMTISMNSSFAEYGMAPIDKNIIISGPRLIHEPVGVVVVGSGSNAIFLECGARANPTPSYKWYRGTYGNETITPGTNSR